MKRAILYFDGSCAPSNPGGVITGAAILIDASSGSFKEDTLEFSFFKDFSPENTNNLAEYHALEMGLRNALELGVSEISIRGDSQLVLRQIQGTYLCKSENLIPLYERCRVHLKKFTLSKILWVPREKNTYADNTARQVYSDWQSLSQ